MLTRICKLTLPGGEIITAKVIARAPEDEPAVEYQGNIDAVPILAGPAFETASPAFLRVLFRNAARESQATLDIQDSGQYDIWAD